MVSHAHKTTTASNDDAGEFVDSTDNRVNWLKLVKLFSGINANEKAMLHIATIMEYQSFNQGTAIVKEGDEGSDAYFLIEGQVRVQKAISNGESFPVAILNANDHAFFGEASLLGNERRMATILTEKSSSCLILHTKAFEQFTHDHPEWALPLVLNISRNILERLHRSNNDVVLLYNALVNEVRGWHS